MLETSHSFHWYQQWVWNEEQKKLSYFNEYYSHAYKHFDDSANCFDYIPWFDFYYQPYLKYRSKYLTKRNKEMAKEMVELQEILNEIYKLTE